MLRWPYRIVDRHISISPYDVMCSIIFPRPCQNSLLIVLSDASLVIFDFVWSCCRLARVLPLSFGVLRRWLSVVFVIDISILGLARLVNINVFAPRWHCIFASIVVVTPFPLFDFALGRFMLAIDDFFLAFDGDSLVAYTSVSVFWRCGRSSINRYCVREAVLVTVQQMLLNASNSIRYMTRWYQLLVCQLFRRYQIARTHREWWSIDIY